MARQDSRKKKLTIVQFLEKSTNNNNYNDSLELKITEMDKMVGNQGEFKKFRTTEVPDFSKLHK